ncbi:MAG: S1 RNA-binding domain-containing protein [Thermoguttaceae bacterium]|jgi:small subunit ribosomal protein S1
MSSDPNDRPDLPETSGESPSNPPEASSEAGDKGSSSERRRILIGSQRDPAAYRPKPRRDWIPIVSKHARPKKPTSPESQEPEKASAPAEPAPKAAEPPVAPPPPPAQPPVAAPSPAPVAETPRVEEPKPVKQAPPMEEVAEPILAEAEEALEPIGPKAATGGRRERVPLPNLRAELSPELEDELQAALGNASIDDLMTVGEAVSKQTALETEARYAGRVVAVRRDDVFVELGGREQGVVPLRQFPQPPEPGSNVEVRVVRFLPEEGIYELSLPHSAAEVGDWSEIEEGMLVDARVTGQNTGGLECEVNKLRGFIPISQIALYRVEDLAQFVGEKFTCVVTEANPERRNLVLSRRAVLEREKEENRQKLWETLEVGQVREGTVRKIMDFGAFVDLGGVDGLLHVSQLGWARVKHPSEMLHEGQQIQVRIQKIDPETRRLGLSYRELMENPWTNVDRKYPVNSTAHGKVTKLMEFGAFVELEPGVEGLVHISELSHKRVWRPSDVVKEGQEIDVVILSVDPEAQRISLSMKSLIPREDPKAEKPEAEPELPPPPKKQKPTGPLRGGVGRSTGGDQFGLKW